MRKPPRSRHRLVTKIRRVLRGHGAELALLVGVAAWAIEALPVPAAPEASAILDRALAALGGAERVASHATWFVEGRGRENLSGELQGIDPDAPTWRDHEERVAVDARTLAVAWERKTPRNDASLRWRRFVRGRDSSGFYDWNAGFGRLRAAVTPEADRRALARRVPHLLLLEASRTGHAALRGEAKVAGVTCDLVEFRTHEGARVTLAIGRTSGRLHRARTSLGFPGFGRSTVDWEWPNWRADAGLGAVPLGARVAVNGTTYQEVRYTAFAADTAAAAALLGVPANRPMGGMSMVAVPAPEAGDAPLPENGVVAPGVHVVAAGNFTVMFVEFADFVVAMEAPENHPGLEGIPASRDTTPVTAGFLAAIRAAAPGKPVRYAILSHHHSDHMGGARVFADAGATLLVAPGHAKAARTACAGGRAPKLETVATRRTITDGRRTLEVHNVGANPHTGENLFAWLPAERIVFQGDLFYYQAGGEFPPSGRETMNRFFARWLDAHGIEPRAVYGVHSDGAAHAGHLTAMRAATTGAK